VSVCEECVEELVKPWLERALVRNDQGVWDPLDGTAELKGLWQAQEEGPRLRFALGRR
jgi:hypothetical protein